MDRSSVYSTSRSNFVVLSVRSVFLLWKITIIFLQTTSSATSSSVSLHDHRPAPQGLHYSPVRWTKSPQNSRQGRPVDVMSDVINDLGVKILDRYLDDSGNVAFSPSGLGFVLVALYEGAAGSSSREISDVLGLPRDRRVVRIGLRDIHRRLRSYLNADAFLGGLTLNREDINLRPDYEETLRFYGFDISDSGVENVTAFGDISSNSTDVPLTLTTPMIPDSNSTDTPIDSTTDNTIVSTGLNDAAEVVTNITSDPSSAMSMATNATSSTSPVNSSLSTLTIAMTNNTNFTNVTDLTATTPMSTDSMTPGTISNTRSSTTLANVQTPSNNNTSTNTSGTIMPMSSLVGISTQLPNTQSQSSNGSITTPMTPTLTPISNSTPTLPTTISTSPMSSASTSISTQNNNSTAGNSTAPVVENPTTNIVEDTATNVVRKRRGLLHRPGGYFTSTADHGIWLDEYGRFNDNQNDYRSQNDDIAVDPRRETEIAFLVNGCDYSRVTGAVYTALLPFSYFPSLRASLLEFPLDDPRYKILIMLPNDENGTRRLARTLVTKPITLRKLRRSLQSAWVTAVVPSFMLRGFVTLTPFLQRLGISDVFDPRAADLTPMSPDLGVYARDIQQSIGVNIRNNAKGGIGGADGGNEDQMQQRDDLVRRVRGVHGVLPFFLAGGAISPRPHPSPHYPVYPGPATPLYERASPVPFVVDRPFLYFIIDDETSVTLLAGRIDDPLNSRML